jgi:SAM-dependent methyltransferase
MSSVVNISDRLATSESASAFQVVQVRPPDYEHAAALTELAESVYFGLRRLKLRAFYREPPRCSAQQIVVGAHLLRKESDLAALPSDAIIYNSEQVFADSPWLKSPYFRALLDREVWDYSAQNAQRLRDFGAKSVRHVPLGYVPELARIAVLPEDIDVLFYGSLNERRQHVLDALKARGLKVAALFGVYGEERDRVIARARVVLNVHFYPTKIFETVRVSYLLANGKAVVAECGPDTSIESEMREAVRAVPYEHLADACVELVLDAPQRTELGLRARRVFAQRREEEILAAALGLQAPAKAAELPPALQIGSGKDYRPECFNADVNAAWGPDAVLDIASPALVGSVVDAGRFGRVTLAAESFERAIANDVLEHIPDLATAMTNVLELLKAGGVFEILVPYDLGHGAWQDPTHVRAFNERSWLYYTDWHWYLGWQEARFDLERLEMDVSQLGEKLQQAGRSPEEILRTPRAVDAMRVRLRKRYLQESERKAAQQRQPGAARS